MTDAATDLNLWALFVSAFVSSTLLPGGSELTLGYLANQHHYPATTLLAVATLGNSLGGMTSWFIGWLIATRFPLKTLDQAKHQRALERVSRWGSPILLLSWLPVIGDPLCVVAGWLKINALKAAFFIAAGKAARYAVILSLI